MSFKDELEKLREVFEEFEDSEDIKSVFFSVASEKEIDNRAIVSSKINTTEDHLATIKQISEEKLEEFENDKDRNKMVR